MASFNDVVSILITANGAQAIGEMERLGVASRGSMGAAEAGAGRAGSSMIAFGAKAATGGALALAGIHVASSAASDMGEAINAANVAMGSQGAAALERYAATAAKTAGIGKTAALQAGAVFGALGKEAGIGAEALGGFSTQLVQLAGDFASLKNTSTDQALEAIQSGLVGEAKPLRQFGVFLTEAATRSEALRVGITSTNRELTEQEKILARASLITTSQAGRDASGDFARTIGTSQANQERAAVAEMQNALATLGQSATPIFTQLASGVASVADAFASLPGPLRDNIGAIVTWAAIGTTVVGTVSTIGGAAIKAGQALGGMRAATSAATGAASGMGSAVSGVVGPLAAAGAAVAAWTWTVSELRDQSDEAFSAIVSDVEGLSEAVKGVDTGALAEEMNRAAQVLGGTVDIGPTNAFEKIGWAAQDFLGFGTQDDEAANKAEAVARQMDTLRASFKGLSEEEKQTAGRQLATYLELVGVSAEKAQGYLDELGVTLGTGADAWQTYAATAGKSAGDLDQLGKAMAGLAGDSEKGVSAVAGYGKALSASFDPLFGLLSANDRLAAAQQALAEKTRTSGEEVTTAYGRVGDAKQRLNDILAEDQEKNFGLSAESAQQQLTEAEAQLRNANERLGRNQGDAGALTDRDKAIQRLEAANARLQEDKRNAGERSRRIRDAQADVAEAERGVSSAKAKAGPDAAEIERAQRDVAQAAIGVQVATSSLAESVSAGATDMDSVSAQLNDLAARGMLDPTLAADLDARFRFAVGAADQLAAGLQSSADRIAASNEVLPGLLDPFGVGWNGQTPRAQRGAPAAGPAGADGRAALTVNVTNVVPKPEHAGAAVVQSVRSAGVRYGRGLTGG